MFGLSDLRQGKVYQEGKAEGELLGKLEAVSGFLGLGLGVEQIALAVGLEVALVQRVAIGEAIADIVKEILLNSDQWIVNSRKLGRKALRPYEDFGWEF